MKIGIITFSDRNTMPYLNYYENALKKGNKNYECIFWDRFTNLSVEKNKNEYTLHIKCLPGANKLGKILPMLKYKYIVEKIIKKEQYTHLIILTTLPGVLINKILLKNFKNKYILDIRDYTYEKYDFYRKIVDELVDKSYFTAISSKGFLEFLNVNEKIVPCHNLSNIEYEINNANDLKNKSLMTIGFVGGVRYFKENCKLIDAFANKTNYRLAYIGKANIDCNLEEYCKKSNIMNVIFKGEFDNSSKPEIYKKIDLINAVYGNDSLEVTTALPNRLYDGLLFKKPIIATKGTYLGNVVEKYKLGIAIDINGSYVDIKKEIDNFIFTFNKSAFERNCRNFYELISLEQLGFMNKIKSFVENNHKLQH